MLLLAVRLRLVVAESMQWNEECDATFPLLEFELFSMCVAVCFVLRKLVNCFPIAFLSCLCVSVVNFR